MAIKAAVLAYSYLRFSSPEQAKGDSVRRQHELRDAWLLRNGVKLDTSLSLRDEGVSGFTGDHRTNPDRHALATFLELVKGGRIPRGSYLIVESLDRLSREDIRPALTLLLNLIDKGVRVVQLLPTEMVYDESVETMQLMMGIVELSRGHSESLMKSVRVGKAWREKKRRAAADGEVLTRRVPGWLTVVDGKFAIVSDRARVVRKIYRLATEGYGLGAITKHLNAEKVPTIGRGEYWARSYVAKILANPAVFGEYQPHKGHAGPKRTPDGPCIAKYFPAILSEEVFLAARASIVGRRNKGGRVGNRINLFQGLLRDARDGGNLHQTDKGQKGGGKLLVSYRAVQGLEGSTYVSFPFAIFEREVLARLREIDPNEILPRPERNPDRALVLTSKLAAVDARIAKIQARLLVDEEIASLVEVLRSLDGDRIAIAAELAAARLAAAAPASESWSEFGSLLELLEKSGEPEQTRTRLRAAIRGIVKEIWCLFLASGRKRYACIQIFFAGGGPSRDYLIAHKPSHQGFQGCTEAKTEVLSGLYKDGEIDLRKQAQIPKIEKALRRVLAIAATEPRPPRSGHTKHPQE